MPIIDCIEKKFSKFVKKRCREKGQGYGFKIGGLKKCAILNFESQCENEKKKCDCIIFSEDFGLIIGLIELKSYIYEVDDVKPQLQAGFEQSIKILEICKTKSRPSFIAIAVIKKGIHPPVSKVLQSKKLKCGNFECEMLVKKYTAMTFQDIITNRFG